MWNANDSHISKVEPFLENCRVLYHYVITLGTISKTMILLKTSIRYLSSSVALDPCSFKLEGNLLKPVPDEYWRIQSLYESLISYFIWQVVDGERNIWLAQTHLRCSTIWPICCCNTQGKCSKSQENNWKWCPICDIANPVDISSWRMLSIFMRILQAWKMFWYYVYICWKIAKNEYEYKPLSNCLKCFPDSIKDNFQIYSCWWQNFQPEKIETKVRN